jgi:hypothetical protein
MTEERARKPLPTPHDWDELFPARFLKAGQLGEKKPTLTIKAVERELLPNAAGKDEARTLLSFVETSRELGINRTNGELLLALFGREVQAWRGKQVTLFRSKTKAFGKTEDCIRIWGSPHLTADKDVEVVLTKRKPNGELFKETLKFTLHKTEPRQPRGDRPPPTAKPF